jgi:hypothetical protein
MLDTSSFAPMIRALGDGGAVAQLGERLVRNEEVDGSIPFSSTNPPNELAESESEIKA